MVSSAHCRSSITSVVGVAEPRGEVTLDVDPAGWFAAAKALRFDVHTVLRQVSYDYERMQYNTVVSGGMKLLNALEASYGGATRTRPLVAMMDNGPIHTSKATRAALAARAPWLTVEWLLETHAHADHLSGARYLQVGGFSSLRPAPEQPRVVEGEVEQPADLGDAGRVVEPGEHLDAAVEVAVHHVGRADVGDRVATALEPEDPAVLQEPAEDRADADVVRQARNTRAYGADAPDQQVDRDTGHRGPVQLIDHGLVDDGVRLDPDPGRATGSMVLHLRADQVDESRADGVGGDQQLFVGGVPAVAGQVVEQVGDVEADPLVGGDQALRPGTVRFTRELPKTRNAKVMRRVVRTLFDLDAVAADTILAAAGIDPDARPETLTPEAFAALLRGRR